MVPARIIKRKITIVIDRRAPNQNLNNNLQWFGRSLGLFGTRDKDKSCFRIFIELLKAAKANAALSSDELGYRLNLSRGTVVHHINRLMDDGIVISSHDKYSLRVDNLEQLVKIIQKDLETAFNELKDAARQIDSAIQGD